MKFWDSSALVCLLVQQKASAKIVKLARKDPSMLVWWGSRIECVSAVSRLSREGNLGAEGVKAVYLGLEKLTEGWDEIQPGSQVRETAIRFLRVHPLRAADALQLAAAWIASENNPMTLEFISMDARLSEAAAREGFRGHELG